LGQATMFTNVSFFKNVNQSFASMKCTIAILFFLAFWQMPDVPPQHSENRLSFEENQLVRIDLTIKEIRNNKGKIIIGFFKDNASFEKEIPFKGIEATKESLKNGVLSLNTQLEPGIYGAALLDDENSNGKMDYNLIGIPKEGFGFSNYYHKGFFKPKIYSFQFEVVASKSAKVEIIMRYLL
jgi:uncharacterized protein (DUF2141 family)